jgi:tetratricopeptide (TPR) repeat protein
VSDEAQVQKLLQAAVKAAREGNKDQARKAFLVILKMQPTNEAAWLGLATTGQDKNEQIRALRKLLELNPQHDKAQEALRRLESESSPPPAKPKTAPLSTDGPFSAPHFDPDVRVKLPKTSPLPPPPTSEGPFVVAGFDANSDTSSGDYSSDPNTYADAGYDDAAYDTGYDDAAYGDAAYDETGYDAATYDQNDYADGEYAETDTYTDAVYDDDDDFEFDESRLGGTPAFDMPPLDEPPLPAPPTRPLEDAPSGSSSLKSLRSLKPADTPPPRTEAVDDDFGEPPLMDMPVPVSRRRRTEEMAAPLFSQLPIPMNQAGVNHIPLPRRAAIENAAGSSEAALQAFLQEALEETAGINWRQKRRGRAGERDITVLRLQVFSATLVFLVVTGGVVFALLLNNPTFRQVVFAPTWTLSPTPTFTPTSTPGVTPTNSPTPSMSPTPRPTLPPTVTPGNPDRDFPPTLTPLYPPEAEINRSMKSAAVAMSRNDLEEAADLLGQAQQEQANTGNFVPYYYLVDLALVQNNPDQARSLIEEGEGRFRGNQDIDQYGALAAAARAKVLLYEARQRLADGGRVGDVRTQLVEAQNRANEAIGLDGRFVEPHLLLAESWRLRGEYDEALTALDDAQAITVPGARFYTDNNLRMAKARIFMEQGNLDAALQELFEVLKINPFERDALRMQIEIALAKNDPGLAVIYSEQYLFYYPNSIEAYRYKGDARLLEDKADDALVQYGIALQGDETDPDYYPVLVSRARLYARQNRFDLAQTDLTHALELGGEDATIRLERMRAAYLNGDSETALADAQALEGNRVASAGELALIQARIQLDSATAEDADAVSEALQTLNNIGNNQIVPELRPAVDEYRARAYFALNDYGDALNAIDRALETQETGSRRYLRGLILQARGDEATNENTKLSEYLAARAEFDFVLAWSAVYDYPFLEDVRDRLDTIQSNITTLREAEET